MRGVSAVAGSDVEEWSILTLPRNGGRADARSVRDPSRVVWTGDARLPAAREIHLLDGPQVVLRTGSGAVHRYEPRSDDLTRVGEVGEDAEWTSWGRYGVFAEPGGELLQVGPEGAWRYGIEARPTWAGAVADGGVAVLAGREGGAPELWLVRGGASEPAARSDSSFRTPALVTAWGRRLAAAGPDGETLRFVAVPSLNGAGAVPLGGRPVALSASPSSHELYVAVGSPPRVLRVNRFARETRTLAETEREVRAIRPATLGSFLLVDDGGPPLWMPLDGESPRRLEGDWRADLPLGAPDGRVLLARGDDVVVWDPADAEAEPVDAPADRWWGAVRWNPAPPPVVSGRVEGESVGAAGADTSRLGAGPPSAAAPPDSLVPEAAAPSGAGAEDRAGRAERAAGADAAAASDTLSAVRGGLPAGFYAVITAARSADGVRRLLEDLSGAGYPTALQRHRDDAGRLWYRGIVGPYDSREEAEAAARQLRRERDVDPWVTEVRAGADAQEIFP